MMLGVETKRKRRRLWDGGGMGCVHFMKKGLPSNMAERLLPGYSCWKTFNPPKCQEGGCNIQTGSRLQHTHPDTHTRAQCSGAGEGGAWVCLKTQPFTWDSSTHSQEVRMGTLTPTCVGNEPTMKTHTHTHTLACICLTIWLMLLLMRRDLTWTLLWSVATTV